MLEKIVAEARQRAVDGGAAGRVMMACTVWKVHAELIRSVFCAV